MNYYPMYPGDYGRDTAHLTLTEHGAYVILLNHQYSTEKPIPADPVALQRICRATTPEERQAVLNVVQWFFPECVGGRMNPRCARQIPKEQERIEIARLNGKKGGRRVTTQRDTQRVSGQEPSGLAPPPPPPTQHQPPSPTQSKAVKQQQKPKSSGDAALAGPKCNGVETWEAYRTSYQQRYQADPVRNAKTNALLSRFVERIGHDEAPAVAAFYLTHNSSYYVSRGHSLDAMLGDAEKLRTEWATNRRVTQTQARQVDQTASNPFVKILEEQRARIAAGK